MLSQLIEPLVADTHQGSHLVKEGTGTTRTVAIHAQLCRTAVEEYDFGILTTNVNQCLSLGMSRIGIHRCCHDFLQEGGIQLFGGSHTDRSRHADADGNITDLGNNGIKILGNQPAHLCMMTLIV